MAGGEAYLFNQRELGEGSVWPPRTAFNGTAVKLLRPLHVLFDRGIYQPVLRGDNTHEWQLKKKDTAETYLHFICS